MKRKKGIQPLSFFLFSIIAMVLMIGCGGQPPKQEVDAANAALQAAITGGAEQYAPEELKNAQALLAKLNTEMGKKDYKAAKQTAIQVKEAADKAKGAIESGKVKAKEAALALVDEVKQGLEKTKGLVAAVESAKLPADLLKPVKEQVAAVEAGVTELDGMVSGEKFKEASDKAAELKGQFAQIEQGIADAKTKAEEAKKAGAKKTEKKK
jgi:outer membrane murein-binding lipoprotein Lpp